jgi:hypothetical protein
MNGHIGKIDLTTEELALLEQIKFEYPSHDHALYLANSQRVADLMALLIQRKGIPQHRINWFTDPDYKRGRPNGSRQNIYERNGTRGRDIFLHPHFLTPLRYMIYGADLPNAAIKRFAEFVKRNEPVGGSDVGDLLKLTKDLANENRIEPHEAADKFFQLALDCGVHLMWALYIEEHVGKMKLRKAR